MALRTDETWHRLQVWTAGSAAAERLAAQILYDNGYQDVDPIHPLGGPDGRKDALAEKDGLKWVMAVYFPRRQQGFKDIKSKFLHDAEGVAANGADGLVFVTNQELSEGQRRELTDAVSCPVDLHHLERNVALLDRPGMYGVRQQFLNIDPPAAEAAGPSWPVQVGSPPLQAVAFQKRPQLLDQLRTGVGESGDHVLTQLFAGDGGVGKTQLAVAAFSDAAAAGTELRVWVDASSRASIVAAFASAFARVQPGSGGSADGEQAAREFLDWLATTARSWVVVLDNVDDPADVRGLWPRGPAGRVLATTRRRDLHIPGAALVPVGVFTPGESLEYLTEKLTGVGSEPARADVLNEASGLAEDVGYLPLALAQAAAVIATDGSSCTAYRMQFADRSAVLAKLFPADAAADEYAHTVATAWSLSIERADRLEPAGVARAVLTVAAVLDPNGIPNRLWSSTAIIELLQALLSGAATAEVTPEWVWRGLRNLHRLSLLTHDPEPEAVAGVRIHALVQRAVLDGLLDEVLVSTVRVAADALLEVWPPIERDTALAATLRRNGVTLSSRHSEALWHPDVHPVLFKIGTSLGDAGQVTDATRTFETLHAASVKILGPNHPDTLTARGNLAYWRGEAGDPAGAAAAYGKLVADVVRVLGPEHPETLIARGNLAYWRGEAGDPAGAVAAHEELLADLVRVLGPDHVHTLTARANLARWRGEAGDAAEAAAAYGRLLADVVRVLGPDHPETLTARGNLAYLRGAAGDPVGAAAAYEELVADRLRVLGPDHPQTLTARGNLARWRGEAGDPAGAVAAHEELLADVVQVLGLNHPHTFTVRANLAYLRGAAGDPAGAVAAYEELLADLVRVLGPDHPDTLTARSNLAYWKEAASVWSPQGQTDQPPTIGG